MNTPEQQAELYRKAADTIEMCAKHGVDAQVKHLSHKELMVLLSFNDEPRFYEFPLAVVEGKLVWKGDELYCTSEKCIACELNGTSLVVADESTVFSKMSWNPPKPKTVMVELPMNVVEYYAGLRRDIAPALTEACSKALAKV